MLGLEAMEELNSKNKRFCECGCGELIPDKRNDGGPRRFKYQHYFRLPVNTGRKLSEERKRKLSESLIGEKNWRWKGGKRKHSGGYMRIQVKDSPNIDEDGYKLEHRYAYEQFHKCCLLSWAVIHHRNRNRRDNRPENLEATTNSKHRGLHRIDMSDRRCSECGKISKEYRRGVNIWRKNPRDKTKFTCHPCYDKIRKQLKY